MNLQLRLGVGILGGLALVAAVLAWASEQSCSLAGALGRSAVAYAGLTVLLGLTSHYQATPRETRPSASYGIGLGLAILGGSLWFGSDVGDALGCPW